MFKMLKAIIAPPKEEFVAPPRRPFIYDTDDVINNRVDDIISVYADADSILFSRTSKKKK